MLTAAILLLLLGQNPAPNTCVSCHDEPAARVQNDVHFKRGLSCVSCHGGDATQEDLEKAMDPRKGFVGSPIPKQVPAFCGRCHSNAETMKRFNPKLRVDQEAEYATSVHGKRVAQGDPKPATCISCHGSHGVLPVNDAKAPVFPTNVAQTCGRCHIDADLMKPYGIKTDQKAGYSKSVHAEAMVKKGDNSAPTCNDCHGNHGAAPPGAAAVANVCGTCHARQAELFGTSLLKAPFDAMGVGECIACHSNHEIRHPTDASVGTTPEAFCMNCHTAGDAGYTAADAIHKKLTSLTASIETADGILRKAGRAGMEVSHARFELNDARDALVNARVVVHSFSPDAVEKIVAPGMEIANNAHRAGENALAELLFRRKGLTISLVVIAFAIVSLYLKIRQIERRAP